MDKELSGEQIKMWEDEIAKMSQREMARFHRFTPSGHPIFDNRYTLYETFQTRFKELGGMTPTISKAIGW